jgi:hypothetical protein
MGEIRYPEAPDKKGVLLYLKPCRDAKAPLSVRSYAALKEAFPHEPTTDQFIGETQFEAYRALGEYAVSSIAASGANSDISQFIGAIESQALAAKRRAAAAVAPVRMRGQYWPSNGVAIRTSKV